MTDFLNISQVFANIGIVIASIVGGTWAYYRFQLSRMGEPNPQLELSYSFLPYSADCLLLVMTVIVRNSGHSELYSDSISLSVCALDATLECGSSPHWNKEKELMSDFDLIHGANPDLEPNDKYWLPPLDEYHEVATLIVPKSSDIYMARVSHRGQGLGFSHYVVIGVPCAESSCSKEISHNTSSIMHQTVLSDGRQGNRE